ncbi:MAG: ethanolamine permease [Bacteroidia bacterium]|nr:ethanolamine permease [Bacteroidia bacterium]
MSQLKKALSPIMLWGLGVGYVISGMYFGWNLGLQEGGTLGMAIAVFFIIIMYVAFSLSYAELACAIPKAGGAFDYANRALGKNVGFIVGIAQAVEFIFAPPAIAIAIGTYFNLLVPQVPIVVFAIGCYFAFTSLNIYGVKAAAAFELVVTFIALAGLVLFAIVVSGHFKFSNLTHNAYPNGWIGSFAAIPFAIWCFLGIEGIANLAEETPNPQRDLVRGFGSAMATLVAAFLITFIFSIGVSGWEAVVIDNDTGTTSDSPLPLVLKTIVTEQSVAFHAVVALGILGMIASFHGLVLAAGRATFELGRVKYIPSFFGKIHPKFQTPHVALVANMAIGIVALLTGKASVIITISVFAALILYSVSMLSLFAFRKKEPAAPRPFKVPFFPITPLLALLIAVFSLVAVTYYYWQLALVFVALMVFAFVLFKIFVRLKD